MQAEFQVSKCINLETTLQANGIGHKLGLEGRNIHIFEILIS